MYKFNRDDARRFAREQGIRTKIVGNELRFRDCPYCRSAKDKDTFAINLDTGMFKCMRSSCAAHGNMVTLHKDFGFSLGSEANEYYDRTRSFRTFPKKEKPVPKDKALEYMAGRGISNKVCKDYNITISKDNENVLVFPFYDEADNLTFIKFRKTDFDPEKDKNKEWCMRDTKPILFGMSQCNMDNPVLIMTEGQIDSLSVAEAGYENAVSVPTGKNGFSWVPYCWDWLQKFKTLIIFGDKEGDNITLLDDMATRFNGLVKHVRLEDYKDCKDANDILRKYGKEQVRKCIDNAVPMEVKEIKDITEVKKVKLSDLEKFNTGFQGLNKILGGFYMGQVILLTGERGKGKRTLASQFGTMAVKAGYNTFFYSGELLDWYFRNWLDLQIAGDRFINKIQNPYGTFDYSVDGNVYPSIEKWYAGRVKIFDNNIIREDEHDDLLGTIQKAITRYSCRVIFIDNLMTAMDDDITSDLNRQQTAFVRKLTYIAKQFNVLIFLIAHPKKNPSGKYTFTNDDVAGSSNITNLVDVVLRYDTPSRQEEDNEDTPRPERVLQVFKNRLTGKVKTDGIGLYYQESSKRISEDKMTFDWELGWEDECFSSFKSVEQMEIPFDV
jgi:archaellum biogenesis ATPase FlaH